AQRLRVVGHGRDEGGQLFHGGRRLGHGAREVLEVLRHLVDGDRHLLDGGRSLGDRAREGRARAGHLLDRGSHLVDGAARLFHVGGEAWRVAGHGLMEAAISSIDVGVSSAAWAWLCAPWLISFALAEICPAEDATCTEASWMLSTTRRRLATISWRLRASTPISSAESILSVSVRSPLATALATSTM